jgi:hypothetical protein
LSLLSHPDCRAAYLGLVGSGVAIAAFFVLTLVGIFFVRLLDGIEGYCTHAATWWKKTNAIRSGLENSAGEA